jgi:regulator of RNase E activity RraA
LERALWGGILNARAIKSGLGGVIIDGAVRDILELKGMPLPVYAAGITPAGPHKGWGGQIGGPVSCGGVSVAPGDIVVGDADGVVVIPFKQESKTYDSSLERIAFEEQLLRKIDLGEDLSEVFKKPKIEPL